MCFSHVGLCLLTIIARCRCRHWPACCPFIPNDCFFSESLGWYVWFRRGTAWLCSLLMDSNCYLGISSLCSVNNLKFCEKEAAANILAYPMADDGSSAGVSTALFHCVCIQSAIHALRISQRSKCASLLLAFIHGSAPLSWFCSNSPSPVSEFTTGLSAALWFNALLHVPESCLLTVQFYLSLRLIANCFVSILSLILIARNTIVSVLSALITTLLSILLPSCYPILVKNLGNCLCYLDSAVAAHHYIVCLSVCL